MQKRTGTIDSCARDFPILKRKINGKRLVYLDSAATSQLPSQVIDAISAHYQTHNANVHRGVYELSAEATVAYEDSRAKIAEFINVKPSGLVFTRNATEAINLVAYTWAKENIAKGDAILLTKMEHHSNLVPWQAVARERKAKLLYAPITSKGELDLDAFGELLEDNPVKLCAFTHCSNVLGTINPIKEMVSMCKDKSPGSITLVDAAQSVPHMKVDFENTGADFLAFSGHKMLGPAGIGCLVARTELLEPMPPFMYGGDMIRTVGWEDSTWNDLPWKFEAGTPNVAGAVGLARAVEYLNALGMQNIRDHESKLTKYAMQMLALIKGVQLYGPSDLNKRTGVVSFNVGKVHSHDVASVLDGFGVSIRAGHHCAMPLMKCLKVSSTARASFYVYNTTDDIDSLEQGILEVKSVFAK